ncbi:SMI1/KNR4 family protein [Micromonospora sp. CA-246542]|uniref:SMI1/KNR4 family protein n=1 Tax=Micromonospora sp. CA-246542 TaxID=3239959 RepID=UPI003D8C0CD2
MLSLPRVELQKPLIEDWRPEIVKAVLVRQEAQALDELYEYPLPEVAATEAELVDAERVVGALDPRYRSLLRFANGWKGFLQGVDLFGTAQLLGGPLKQIATAGQREVTGSGIFNDVGFRIDDALAIGASDTQADLWFISAAGDEGAGKVLWFWGDGFEVFGSFDEFFLSMVDYNRLELQRLKKGDK